MRRREVRGKEQRVGFDAMLQHRHARRLRFLGRFAEFRVSPGLDDLHRVVDDIAAEHAVLGPVYLSIGGNALAAESSSLATAISSSIMGSSAIKSPS